MEVWFRLGMDRIERKEWLKTAADEHVLWWDHPALIKHMGSILTGIFLIFAAVLFQFVRLPVEIPTRIRTAIVVGGIGLGLGLVIFELVRRRFIYYIVTTNKVWHTRGILAKTRNPIRYTQIVNTVVHQSYLDRFLSYIVQNENIGSLEVHTADDEGGDMRLNNIPRIELVAQMVEDGIDGIESAAHAEEGGAAARHVGFDGEQPADGDGGGGDGGGGDGAEREATTEASPSEEETVEAGGQPDGVSSQYPKPDPDMRSERAGSRSRGDETERREGGGGYPDRIDSGADDERGEGGGETDGSDTGER